mgnify:CR=1 FL=1
MRPLFLFVILLGMWLLMSGHYTPLITSLGVISCGLAAALAHLMGGTDRDGLPMHLFARLPGYLVWLFWEIITSNITTGRVILKNNAHEEWFEVTATQTSDAGIVTYANSITLTPGTVTVDVTTNGNGKTRFLVHALHPDFGDDVRDGEMDRRVSAVESSAA